MGGPKNAHGKQNDWEYMCEHIFLGKGFSTQPKGCESDLITSHSQTLYSLPVCSILFIGSRTNPSPDVGDPACPRLDHGAQVLCPGPPPLPLLFPPSASSCPPALLPAAPSPSSGSGPVSHLQRGVPQLPLLSQHRPHQPPPPAPHSPLLCLHSTDEVLFACLLSV